MTMMLQKKICRVSTIKASSVPSFKFDRKAFEEKRYNHIKENFNKFVAIGNSEIKMYTDLIKELDEYHKNLSKKKESSVTEDFRVLKSDEFLD